MIVKIDYAPYAVFDIKELDALVGKTEWAVVQMLSPPPFIVHYCLDVQNRPLWRRTIDVQNRPLWRRTKFLARDHARCVLCNAKAPSKIVSLYWLVK